MRLVTMAVLSLMLHAILSDPVRAADFEVRSDSSLRLLPDTWLRRGAPVRARLEPGGITIVGSYEGTFGDSLRLRPMQPGGESRSIAVPVTAIRTLDLAREQPPRTWSGFAIGFLVGAAAGAALGSGSASPGDRDAGAILGAMVFAPIGSLIGSLIGSSNHAKVWVPVRVPEVESARIERGEPAASTGLAGSPGGKP